VVTIDAKKLNASLTGLINKVRVLGESGMPNTVKALDIATAFIQAKWTAYASGEPIPSSSRTVNSQSYRDGIATARLGALTRVVFNDSKTADYIEYGHPRIDMKQSLPTARSYKSEKDGHYYNIVPFRHDVKKVQASPQGRQLYKEMKNMEKSFVTGSRIETQSRVMGVSGGTVKFMHIKRATYTWGSRLTGMTKTHGAQFKNMEGLVRMETTTGASKGSSAYMTFRVMSEKSPANKWIIPELKGLPLSEIVGREVVPDISRIIEAGVRRDLNESVR
jgi:hypothetical protein